MTQDDPLAPRRTLPGWLIEPIRRHRGVYLRVAVAAVAINLLGLVTSMFSMTVYDRVVPNDAMASLVVLTIGVGIALLFDFVLRLLRSQFVDLAGTGIDDEVGGRVFARLLTLRPGERRSTGQLAGLMRELESLREFFASATLVALVDVPFVVVSLFVTWLIGGAIVLVPAVIVLLVIAVALVTQPMMRGLARRGLRDSLTKNAVLIEAIAGLDTLQACNATGFMRGRWNKAMDDQAQSSLRQRFVASIAVTAAGSAQTLSYVGVVVVGAAMVGGHAISTGAIVACSMLSGRAIAPIGQITQLLTRLHATRTAFQSIDAMMRGGEAAAALPVFTPERVAGRIELRRVSLLYPGKDVAAIDDVTLAVEAGQWVALVGRIGSGKTTLARLMAGLIAPTSGQVLIDGLDVRSYDPGDLRAAIGVVPQESELFSGTIGENISLDRPGIDAAEVIRAAKLSGTHDWLDRMSNGYSVNLADRGQGLSGGQRQSIAIARALAGAPPVMVLDEPSSAMDAMSEQILIDRLREELAGRTVLFVTHRPQLLHLADRVIRIEDGRVHSDTDRATFVERHVIKAA